jgi:hydroxymethylbilane synthase
LTFVPVRGNIDTRLRKLKGGDYDGLVLAAAGLRRLGLNLKTEPFAEDQIVPAPGQGALALEARADRPDILALLSRLDHRPTRLEVELERAFLLALGGNCSVPLAARAKVEGDQAAVKVFYAQADGSGAVRLDDNCRDMGQHEAFGRDLAARVLSRCS